MAQAFAYYNFTYPASEIGATAWPIGQIVYTPGQTQAKYHINNTNFPQGFNTPDDSWNNRWRTGPNQVLGWSAALPGSGNGAKSLGQELESSHGIRQLPGDAGVQGRVSARRRNAADVNPGHLDDRLLPSAQLLVAAGLRRRRRLLHGELSMNSLHASIGLLALAASLPCVACGGGGAPDHADPGARRRPAPPTPTRDRRRRRRMSRPSRSTSGTTSRRRIAAASATTRPRRRRCRTSRAATM